MGLSAPLPHLSRTPQAQNRSKPMSAAICARGQLVSGGPARWPPAPWQYQHRRQPRAGQVLSFAVGKAIGGMITPNWLPDWNLEKRKAVLHRFFSQPPNRQVYEELLDEQFRMREQLREEAGHSRTYGKHDFVELMCSCVAPAIPDFTWSAATDGEVDQDGFAIVVVKVSGHHTGAPLALPGLPDAVPPSGRRVALEEDVMKVRVEGGKIKEIEVLPSEGAGPLALYKAVGGQVS